MNSRNHFVVKLTVNRVYSVVDQIHYAIQNFGMDKFFWIEVMLPVFLTGILYLVVKSLLSKFQKLGYRWGILFSILALLFMISVWMYVGKYSNAIQCQAAYGDLASDPKMCDNPANGILAMLQVPVLAIAWTSISIFALFKLRPLNQKSSIT